MEFVQTVTPRTGSESPKCSHEVEGGGDVDRVMGGAGGDTWAGCIRWLDALEATHQGVPLALAGLRAGEADSNSRLVSTTGCARGVHNGSRMGPALLPPGVMRRLLYSGGEAERSSARTTPHAGPWAEWPVAAGAD